MVLRTPRIRRRSGRVCRRGRPIGNAGRAWLEELRPTDEQRAATSCEYIAINLGRGPKAERWVSRCPPRPDDVPVDLIHARAVAAELQRRFDVGEWDPRQTATSGSSSGASQSVLEFARAWIATQRYESAPKDRLRIERYLARSPLAVMCVGEVRAKHVLAFIRWLEEQPSARGGTLAPRTVRNIYDGVRRALDAAVIDELLAANPCHAVHGKLPSIEDKVPGARQGWLFSREEIAALITDPRIPRPRRTAYALQLLTGCRIGELAVLRFRDYDATATPLGRLTISRAIKSVSKREAQTKTGAIKTVPVHPVLAIELDAWQREGWPAFQGRPAETDDLIIPNQYGRVRNTNHHNHHLARDCTKLGIAARHQHCMRHTFITRVQDDGGDGNVIRWITHAPPRSAFDGYTRAQWSRLCAELAKLRVDLALAPNGSEPSLATPLATNQSEVVESTENRSGKIVGARGFEEPQEGHGLSRNAVNLDGFTMASELPVTSGDPLAMPLATAVANEAASEDGLVDLLRRIAREGGPEVEELLVAVLDAVERARARSDARRVLAAVLEALRRVDGDG